MAKDTKTASQQSKSTMSTTSTEPTGLGAIRKCIYDSKRGAVLGRTGKEWLRVLAFYLVFYVILLGMLIGMIKLAEKYFIDIYLPTYYGPGSILGNKPYLMTKAPSGNQTTLGIVIKRRKGNDTVYNTTDIEAMRELFRKYANNASVAGLGIKKGRPCLVDLSDAATYGECACNESDIDQVKFGYDEDKPCVALALSKIIGWSPQSENLILTCNVTSHKVNGSVVVYPESGVSKCHFPYQGKATQPNYLEPLFLVEINTGKMKGDKFTIECKQKEAMKEIKIDLTLNA